jgi:hypothetical protein
MPPRVTFLVLAAALLWAGVRLPAAGSTAGREDARLLDRFFENDDSPPLCSFSGVRHLTASNTRYKVTGWLDAQTELDPIKGFHFTVIGEGGSGLIRTRVLKKALEREAMARQERELGRAALTRANYAFGESMPDEMGLLRINIQPRRREELLVDGTILVTSPEADLVRIEGRLAKNPSFWTKRVDIVRRYERVNGVRVPVEMSSTADVLVVGHSSFTMRYDYATVNGVPVGAAPGNSVTSLRAGCQ